MADARPFRRRLLVNTAATGAGNVWAMVVVLVSLPVLLAGLGSAAFGTWVLLQTFSATTGWLSLADVGIRYATTTAVAEQASLDDHDAVGRTTASGYVLLALFGLTCGLLLGAVGPWTLPILFDTPDGLVDALRWAIVLFAVQVVVDFAIHAATASLEGLQRVDRSRAVEAVRRTVTAAATMVAAALGGGLVAVAGASLGATVLAAVISVVVLARSLPHPVVLRPARSTARSLLGSGKAVAAVRPFGVVHRMMDRLIVGAVLGPSAVVYVEIATQIQNGADAVGSATSYAAVPGSAWLDARDDRASLRELLEVGTKYSMLVTMPFVVAPALLAAPLIELWVGTGYGPAVSLTVLGLLYIALSTPLQVANSLLLGTGNGAAVLRAVGVAVVVNLVASLALVGPLGIDGVFLGTLVAAPVLIVGIGRAALRVVGTSPAHAARVALLPCVAPSLAMAVVVAAVLALPLGALATVVLGGAAGMATYAAVGLRWSMVPGELAGLRRALSTRATP